MFPKPTHRDYKTRLYEPQGKTGMETITFLEYQALCMLKNAFKYSIALPDRTR